MPRCCISLGGNRGNVADAFRHALQQLNDAGYAIRCTSRTYRTAPVGPHAGDPFLNACAVLDTNLPPQRLLADLHACESAAGRARSVRWGARTLDLDLLTYGNRILNDPNLTLPHPGLLYRRFVLDPLVEIAPRVVHPVVRRTIAGLQQRLLKRPLPIRLVCRNHSIRRRIGSQLDERWPGLLNLVPENRPSAIDPTIVIVGDAGRSRTAAYRSQIASPASQRRDICVCPDPALSRVDPVAAVMAVAAAMLDEPQPVGRPLALR